MRLFLEYLLRFAAFTAIGCTVTGIMMKSMRKQKFRVETRVFLSLTVFVCGCLFCRSAYDLEYFSVGLALYTVLLYASTEDITFHKAENWLSVMILLLGITQISREELPLQLLGAAVVFVPQLIIAACTKKRGIAIGGADMKLSTAAAFLLGFSRGIIAYMLGLFAAIVTELIRGAVRARKTGEKCGVQPFPLIPYLSVGILTAYLL